MRPELRRAAMVLMGLVVGVSVVVGAAAVVVLRATTGALSSQTEWGTEVVPGLDPRRAFGFPLEPRSRFEVRRLEVDEDAWELLLEVRDEATLAQRLEEAGLSPSEPPALTSDAAEEELQRVTGKAVVGRAPLKATPADDGTREAALLTLSDGSRWLVLDARPAE